ncbi:MAG: putative transport protein, partial [Chloroflexi bacterium]|nr:putative transport protein [Chloroflexota bacterium]
RRFGPRRVVTLGMGLEAAGIIAVSFLISPGTSGVVLAVPLFFYGIGVGFATAQLTSIVLSDVPVERSGLASGANSTIRQVGSALGIAILGTVLFVSLSNGASERFATIPPPSGLPPAVATEVNDFIVTALEESAGQVLVPLRDDPSTVNDFVQLPPEVEAFLASPAARAFFEPYVAAADEAFAEAARMAGLVAAGFVLLGVLFSLLLPATKPQPVAEASASESAPAPAMAGPGEA